MKSHTITSGSTPSSVRKLSTSPSKSPTGAGECRRGGARAGSAMHITASVFVNDHESGLWADILKWLETTIAPWDPKR